MRNWPKFEKPIPGYPYQAECKECGAVNHFRTLDEAIKFVEDGKHTCIKETK